MRTNLEFRSVEFSEPSIAGVPRGESIARFLGDRLPQQGFEVISVSAEDWGWRVEIANSDFPLWMGCGHYEEWEDGLLCFIEPSRPYFRRWFKRVSTTDTVERLAGAIEAVVRESGKARDLRWWGDEENARG